MAVKRLDKSPIVIQVHVGMTRGQAEKALAWCRKHGYTGSYLKPRGEDLYSVAVETRQGARNG